MVYDPLAFRHGGMCVGLIGHLCMDSLGLVPYGMMVHEHAFEGYMVHWPSFLLSHLHHGVRLQLSSIHFLVKGMGSLQARLMRHMKL